MSWSLNASGHIPAADPSAEPPADGSAAPEPPADGSAAPGQDTMAVEVALYEALKGVLEDPRFGTAASSFGGSHVSGSLHVADS
jgi:hypothetical protein